MNYNCSIFWDLRNLQEQVEKAFCYQKLFWPFTVWINCSSDLKFFANSLPSASNFKSFSQSLEQFFLTLWPNTKNNKIPFLQFLLKNWGSQVLPPPLVSEGPDFHFIPVPIEFHAQAKHSSKHACAEWCIEIPTSVDKNAKITNGWHKFWWRIYSSVSMSPINKFYFDFGNLTKCARILP